MAVQRSDPVDPRSSRTAHRCRSQSLMVGLAVGLAVAPVLVAIAPGVEVAAAAPAPRPRVSSVSPQLVWQQALPDAGSPIGEASPSVATLDGGGPSVVVGDRTGTLWAFHLSNGTAPAGWPAHTGGAPIDSTASVAPVDGSGYDSVFVPDEGGGLTFAEMPAKDKHVVSHRGRAFRALADQLAELLTGQKTDGASATAPESQSSGG